MLRRAAAQKRTKSPSTQSEASSRSNISFRRQPALSMKGETTHQSQPRHHPPHESMLFAKLTNRHNGTPAEHAKVADFRLHALVDQFRISQ